MASQPDAAQVIDAVAPEAQPVDAPKTTAPLYPDDQPAPEKPQTPQDDQPQPETGDPAVTDDSQPDDQPAIDAPASWAKDAKDVFAGLPREAQEIIAGRERERDTELRRAQNSAAQARQTAERDATSQLRTIYDNISGQYEALARQIQPQEPDIRLLQSPDPQHHALYNEQDRQFRIANAQFQQIAQQAQAARQQSEQIAQAEQQQLAEAEHSALVEAIPEWSDPSTRTNLLQELEPIGAELGYSRELMAQAGATDILALRKALSWKRDSDELRTLKNKAKMIPVRAAKQTPPVAPVRAPSATAAKPPVGSLAQQYPDDMPR